MGANDSSDSESGKQRTKSELKLSQIVHDCQEAHSTPPSPEVGTSALSYPLSKGSGVLRVVDATKSYQEVGLKPCKESPVTKASHWNDLEIRQELEMMLSERTLRSFSKRTG